MEDDLSLPLYDRCDHCTDVEPICGGQVCPALCDAEGGQAERHRVGQYHSSIRVGWPSTDATLVGLTFTLTRPGPTDTSDSPGSVAEVVPDEPADP